MWWCCGRSNRLDKGCKIGFHKNKDFTKNDESEQNKSSGIALNNRCICCKLVGHFPEDCPKDPNFREHYVVSDEFERINNLNKKFDKKKALTKQTLVQKLDHNELNEDLQNFKRQSTSLIHSNFDENESENSRSPRSQSKISGSLLQKSKTLLPMVEEFENLDDNCSEESEVKKEEEQDMFEDLVKERLSLVPPLSKFDLRELVRSLELQNISRSRKLSDFRGQSSTDNGLLKPE